MLKGEQLWHANRVQISCQVGDITRKLVGLVPRFLPTTEKKSPSDFTRTRKLPLEKLIVFILHLTASGKPGGIDIQAGSFFGAACRSGMWPHADAPSRSAVSKRRGKIDWTVFRDILRRAVKLAYELWPNGPEHTWKGMNVLAIDGSKYTLPATQALRRRFDPTSGLTTPGKGHYPQCLVSTLFDVLRRLPVARTVTGCDGSERDEALELLQEAPSGSLVIFDRGYPSYEMLLRLMRDFSTHFLMRCPATNTFAPIMHFIRSGRKQAVIEIGPSSKQYDRTPRAQWATLPFLTLRAIRMTAPDGTVSVLLTDLTDTEAIRVEEFIELYRRRWAVETQYRDEKREMHVECFHGKTPNSVLQELYAIAIVAVIARLLSVLMDQTASSGRGKCQLKNACIALAHNIALMATNDAPKAARFLEDLLEQIARVRYYRPTRSRPNQPRITKRSPNKWIQNRAQLAAPA
jgi:hypothetical protein